MLTKTDLLEIGKMVDRIVKKYVKNSEKRIISRLNLVIKDYESADSALEHRVARIEKHLNLN